MSEFSLNVTMEDLARLEAEGKPPEPTPVPPPAPEPQAPAPQAPQAPPAPAFDPAQFFGQLGQQGYQVVPKGAWPGSQAPQPVDVIPGTDIPKPPGYDTMEQEDLTIYVSQHVAAREAARVQEQINQSLAPIGSILEVQARQALTASVPEYAREDVDALLAQVKAENGGVVPAQLATDPGVQARFVKMAIGEAVMKGRGPAAPKPVGEGSTEVVGGQASDGSDLTRAERKTVTEYVQTYKSLTGVDITFAQAVKELESQGLL